MYLLAAENNKLAEVLRDAIIPEGFELAGVSISPGIVSAIIVAGALLLVAALIRIFVIPRFKTIPGKFQALLEKAVEFFADMAKGNSPHRYGYLGAFAFAAGIYIFFGTLFELFGLQIVVGGKTFTLPAVMSDINACIAIALSAFLSILIGAVRVNKVKGFFSSLIDFSLPISMSFRLFGSLLSGLLVTELVYQVAALYFSVVVPVIVAVLFTMVHAIVQAFILPFLTSLFYGEKTEPAPPKSKKNKKKVNAQA
jgi:F-type H+-transporting ATPase subunit a